MKTNNINIIIKNFIGIKYNYERNIDNIICSYIRQLEYLEIINKYENDWIEISYHKYLTEEFIEQNYNKVSWQIIVTDQKLSEDFIKKYTYIFNYTCWFQLSNHQTLSEEFIEQYIDKLNIYNIFEYQNLSEKFIKKYIKKIKLEYPFYEYDKKFIKKYSKYLFTKKGKNNNKKCSKIGNKK